MSTAVSRYCRIALSVLLFCYGASFSISSTYADDTRFEHDEIDPHVYAYTAEFAKEFGMPVAWVSDELDGVDAVAYRVMPKYKSCGWGGKLDVCFRHETRCEVDLYFDQRRNPLHWDERHPIYKASNQGYSSYFISSSFVDRSPVRAGDYLTVRKSPLINHLSGRGVNWQYRATRGKGKAFGLALSSSYERNVFDHIDRVTIYLGCFNVVDELVLVDGDRLISPGKTGTGIVRKITFPATWSLRAEMRLNTRQARFDAFLRIEGEKILKKLREQPASTTPIIPVH